MGVGKVDAELVTLEMKGWREGGDWEEWIEETTTNFEKDETLGAKSRFSPRCPEVGKVATDTQAHRVGKG